MNYDFISLLLVGISLGFWAGITPGPMLVLTISETIKHGRKEGLKVAFAPLLTDTPIVAGSVFILSTLSNVNGLLSAISIIGALFLLYFGYENLSAKKSTTDSFEKEKISSLKKAVITNFLNPNPYVFWMTVGGPILVEGIRHSEAGGISFIVSFYILLVGIKVIIAFVGGKLKEFFKSDIYIWIVRVMGLVLILFSVLLFVNGINKLMT